MSNDDSDDLAYNPFADDNDPGGSNKATAYYSSAFFPSPGSPTTTLRRRRSSLSNGTVRKQSPGKKHRRAPSDIEIVPQSPSLHPLKSALAATIGAVFQDTGVTRPSLSRLVSDVSHSDEPEGDSLKKTESKEEEKDVLVHQITLKDSLAGVSLKYGITLANLRRANQLWTSDSIHRHSVLYIPIDQASRAREYISDVSQDPSTSNPSREDRSELDFASSSASPVKDHVDNSDAIPKSPPLVPVTRLPARQLSYFPPSSNKNSATHLDYLPSNHQSIPPPHRKTSHKYDTSLTNTSFASILTALPISAATRDEIITRLSLDSVSSSFTDRSRANSDDDTGHEMNDVGQLRNRRSNVFRKDYEEGVDGPTTSTPKARLVNPPFPRNSLSESRHLDTRSLSASTPPRFYVPHAQETHLRTSQMEPSPNMQVPLRRSITVGPSAGKRHLAAMGVVNGKSGPDNLSSSKRQLNEFH